jgi:tetratricopeptide (TPR) repeat protein
MYNHNRKIKRDSRRSMFNQRRSINKTRWGFILFALGLIVALPLVTYWQYDRIQLAALDRLGYAPTATPFASVRASTGEEFYRRGDIETAADYFEVAVAQQPENLAYLYGYGNLLIELDRNDEAVTLGERMIAINPDDPRGYALKATAIAWTDPTVAIPTALEGYEVDRNYSQINSALTIAYTRIGRYVEALQRGDLAIRQDPSDASARRSYAYPLIFTGNYSEAIRQLERAIAINPNITGPYFELASLYRNRAINRPEVAVSIYLAILEIEPDSERAYLRLCETYAAVGLFRDAEPYCDAALDIDPEYASAHRMRGQLRYSRRNYEGAIDSFDTCIELSDDPAQEGFDEVEIECVYIRGLAHYFLGNDNCDDAWFYLNEALNHPQAVDSVETSILQGLENTRRNCGYADQPLPTPIPPTPIPPTPIGGY